MWCLLFNNISLWSLFKRKKFPKVSFLFLIFAQHLLRAVYIFSMPMNIATTLLWIFFKRAVSEINVPLFRKDFPTYLICRKSHKNYSALRFNVTVPSFPFASRRDLLAPHSQRRRRLLIFVEYFLDFGRTTLRAYCAVLSDEGRKI